MIVTNKRQEQYSLDIPLADGQQIRELIPPGMCIEIRDINPFDINTFKILRNEVFVDQDLDVCFESEPDDLPCLTDLFSGNVEVQEEGATVVTAAQIINFVGAAVTATAGATPNTVDVTVTADPSTGVVTVDDFREYVTLLGTKDGSNLTFTLPDKALHAPPKLHVKVFRNGVLQRPGATEDYTLSESGGSGTGYDTITFASGCAPRDYEDLWAMYVLHSAG